MNKAEAGLLGALKSLDTHRANKEARIQKYLESPTRCTHCQTGLPYEKRAGKFCSKSCAATFNNAKFVKRKVSPKSEFYADSPNVPNFVEAETKCNFCFTKIRNGRYGKQFCNSDCHIAHKRSIKHKAIEDGTVKSGRAIKKYIIDKFGNKCSKCEIDEWNGAPIVMELEHIDGNSENNNLENCCLLCPNCHSQTPTYKGRNIGNGRHYRRVRYAEGKSY